MPKITLSTLAPRDWDRTQRHRLRNIVGILTRYDHPAFAGRHEPWRHYTFDSEDDPRIPFVKRIIEDLSR